MGALTSKISKEERARRKQAAEASSAIDKGLSTDFKSDTQVIKLLLLGAGESGKSTLFKQMVQLYGTGFDKATLEGYKESIFQNIVQSMAELVQLSDALDEEYGCKSGPEVQPHKEIFLQASRAQRELVLTPEVGKSVAALWSDAGIRKAFSFRTRLQIPDSADYFFDNVGRIATPGYSPTYQDVLKCRARTTGIVETDFQIKRDRFKLMDVGGQRNERKKWIHCFEGVTAVLFVAALSEYDQVLFEDSSKNRMQEALELFDEICNNRYFEKSAMILFLNKKDLFADKLKKVDLAVTFPDYKGGPDERKAALFIQDRFLAKNKKPGKMKVYCHITCATDANNINFTFNTVRQTIVDASLIRSGLQ